MGVRILIKSSIKGYSEEQEGERGRDKFSYSDRSTTAFHHTDHIQVFPGFTLLQDRWESSGKDDTHLWGNHIEKKKESYSTWLPNMSENSVYFTCLYLIVYFPKITFPMTPSWGF